MENVNQHRLVLVNGRKKQKIFVKKSKKYPKIVPVNWKSNINWERRHNILEKGMLNGHGAVPVNTTLKLFAAT